MDRRTEGWKYRRTEVISISPAAFSAGDNKLARGLYAAVENLFDEQIFGDIFAFCIKGTMNVYQLQLFNELELLFTIYVIERATKHEAI
jgi:hypothetical protein